MPQMRFAGVANRLHAPENGGSVKPVRNGPLRNRLRERRPACVGLKLLVGIEQQCIAANAGIKSGLKPAAHLGAERPLRSRLPRHAVLLRGQLFHPLGVTFYNLVFRGRIPLRRKPQNIGPGQHPCMVPRRSARWHAPPWVRFRSCEIQTSAQYCLKVTSVKTRSLPAWLLIAVLAFLCIGLCPCEDFGFCQDECIACSSIVVPTPVDAVPLLTASGEPGQAPPVSAGMADGRVTTPPPKA